MKTEKKNASIVSNIIWRFLEKFSAKMVTFVVSIILARLLDPAAYGTVALVTVFTSILEVFIDSGLGNALIQKKDADDLDFSSVFYFNVVMCLVLYMGMYFAAPSIAKFYELPDLVPIVRVQSLTLVISGVKNIQYAYISRNMMFRKFFFATLFGTFVSAIVGLAMAFNGCGVWALVMQPLVNYGIDTVVLWYTVTWRPKLMFSWKRLKGLLSYGWKLLAAKLLNTSYMKVRDLLIGKFYSTADLAFFNKGDAYPAMLVPNITSSIDGVIFPAMAKCQNDVRAVKSLVKKSTQCSSFIVMPMMAGLMACANPLIELLMTSKWLPCVPYLYMYCIVYAFWPLSIANLNSIRALGRSDIFLKLEIIEKVVSVALLLCTMRISVFAMGISYMIGELFSAVIVMLPNAKLIHYSPVEQMKDLVPLIFGSVIMGVVVYAVQLLKLSCLTTLLIQVPVGVLIYLSIAKVFDFWGLDYFMGFVSARLKR